MNEPRRRRLGAVQGALLLAGVLLSMSCSSKDQRPELFPVQGQLFLERKPAHNAIVWFHPAIASGKGCPRPHATVKEDGSFEVGTLKSNDGAPAGRYKLTVIWRAPAKSGDEDGASLIPLRYMEPEKSGLPVVEVAAGPTTLPPINLSKR
jgi:hypothetical protein